MITGVQHSRVKATFKVLNGSGLCAATCPCGWTTGWRRHSAIAAKALKSHVLDSMKGTS